MIEASLALAFGLLIGSFLNVCIYRLPRDLSVVRPRSHCPHCGRTVAWYDNVPILSYLLLRGRCRHCGVSISARYPLVEALTGALFLVMVVRFGPTGEALKWCVFAAIMVALFFTDWEERILPDEFTLGGTLAGLGFAWLLPLPRLLSWLVLPADGDPRWSSLVDAALAALIPAGALWALGEVYYRVRGREGLGLGDVKLVACLGTFLGLSGVVGALLVGSLAGSVLGLAFLLVKRQDARTYELPFGSFLAAAGVVAALAGF